MEITQREPTLEETNEILEKNKLSAIAEKETQNETKRQAYARISDPIFMQWQRGLKTEKDWLDSVAQVDAEFTA